MSDPLEASYLAVHLWALAVQTAGSENVAAIRRALCGQRFQAPEGEVRVDPDTQHLWKTARVARITSKGSAQIVWTSGDPVRPVPFPASRSREQWEGFVEDLRQRWGGQWASPSR
jgi:urea transport system substrate-binding protein